DPGEALRWMENMGIDPMKKLPPHNSFVCIQHFEPEVVGGKCLRKGALPTLNLDSKIFCLFDYCHLIKSVRNTLLKYDIQTSDGIASFKVIRKLYAIDKENPHFKICPKLTEAHVYPAFFEKMSVSRATQVLSNSVAAGIGMAYSQNLLGNDQYVVNCAKPTQIFVKKMNDLFDELDVKHFSTNNPLRSPIRRGDTGKIERLNGYIKYLDSFKFPNNSGSLIKCINGFRLTILAMQQLSEEIFDQHANLNFIFLGKMNQDALENFFYRIRASQGINTHPSAHDVQYIVERLISMKILRQRFENKGTNCEDDDDINLDWDLCPEDRHLEETCNETQCEELAVDEIDIDDENFVEQEAEVQVQRYYVGYGIYQKLLRNLNCDICASSMTKSQEDLKLHSEALIKAKNYKGDNDLRLVNPEDNLFE
ncbi:uncharacterized protein LOC118756078, partial [Rhagoletis pomonella]|uniref:uncharacterized protein LOC118756078 n=1 Tax=Rhagoletis pomonella TaxID=28610 RepID=UPI0017840DE4